MTFVFALAVGLAGLAPVTEPLDPSPPRPGVFAVAPPDPAPPANPSPHADGIVGHVPAVLTPTLVGLEPTAPDAAASTPAPAIPSPTAVQLTPTAHASPKPAPMRVVIAAPSPARTRVEAGLRIPRGWAFDLSAGTSVPLAVGAAFQVEAPARVLAQLEVGGLLARYVDVLDATSAAARREPPGAGLARDVSRNAMVVRAAVGVRPLRRRGLEVRGGYTVVTHGQSLVGLDTIGALADSELGGDERPVPVRGALHNVHFDIGWRWVIRRHFLVRAAIGYVHSLAAKMLVSDVSSEALELIRRTNEALGRIAENGGQAALRAPLLALHLGYRF
ncbi:hypothetical protein [Nannocystis punicea]|uniref:Outer membrane protein beta-barrel domain-containing protein n=1 Tax=Nannocystis punicea TaxID=2995304 RepID=A0ABY7GT79_9BACT|nr:hypothetical protein [Nannocystis poenicansa]WAS90124.1 hypothetical protein O0S08_28350 [Nannocystis poenicansa]